MICNVCGVETEPISAKKVLKKIGKIKVLGVRKFVAAEKFREGLVSGINIMELDDHFKENFLDKIERNVKPATLNVWEICERTLDIDTSFELGTDKKEISLAHFWAILKKRSKAKNPKGLWGCIHGTDGKLWTVNAYRYGGGWSVFANSSAHPFRWLISDHVLSR